MITKVLVVDDSPISRKMLKSCFPKDVDFEFVEAGDGLSGLNAFIEHGPDITFLDLTMPVMDGVEALEKIRQHDPVAPVIVATADIQLKSIDKVMGLGALLVLKKPPTKDALLEALAQATAYREQHYGN
jgi:two-component system, chemotaxis family, chemotaxis protein CheY